MPVLFTVTMASLYIHRVLLLTSALLTFAPLTAAVTTGTTFTCTTTVPSSRCGSVLDYTVAGSTVHGKVYVFSADEKAGDCSREGLTYTNQDHICAVSATLNDCKCKNKECESCMSGKTKADVTTCCGKVIEYAYAGQTYYHTDTTTKKADCCFAQGSDAAGKTTHECYCKAGTDGCYNLCPAPPATPVARVMGGQPVATDACAKNIVRFTLPDASNNLQLLCQAPLVYHPSGVDTAGTPLKDPFYLLTSACKTVIEGIPAGVTMKVILGDSTFAYNKDEVTLKELKDVSLSALTFNKYTGACKKDPLCSLNKATMEVNTTDCHVLSFADGTIPGSLTKSSVTRISTDCVDPTPAGKKAHCFVLKDPAYSCTGDIGSPVFCSLTKTGEPVVYGAVYLNGDCSNAANHNTMLYVSPLN